MQHVSTCTVHVSGPLTTFLQNNSPAEGWLWELISCKKNNLILVREITANLFLKISEDTAILQQSNWIHLISVSTRVFPEFPAYNPQKNILQSPSQHEAIDEAGLGFAPGAKMRAMACPRGSPLGDVIPDPIHPIGKVSAPRIGEVREVSAKSCKSVWDAVRQQSSISFNARCFLLL